MATFSDLQANVAATLSRADLTSQIQEAIKRAVRHYERETFWFNRAEDSFVTSATPKQAFTISDTNTFLQVTQVVVKHNSDRYEVQPANLEEVKAINAENDNGIPTCWALEPRDRTIIFDRNINVTCTVSYTYLKKNATLSAAGDTNEFSTYAPDLIEARACWWLYLTKIKNMPAAQAMRETEAAEYQSLKGEQTLKTASGRITPTKF